MSRTSDALVIGVGNSWSGDDAAGVLVARALRGRVPEGVEVAEHEGEPSALLHLWEGRRLAVVVDAIAGSGAAGEVRCFDVATAPLPTSTAGRSTHAFTVAQAIELARALDRLPPRAYVVGIEGQSFEAGAEVGPEVAMAVAEASERVLALVRRYY